MARRRSNDPTRRLRADRLTQYARDADRSARDASAPKPPEIAVSVGYTDEEGRAATHVLSADAIPLLVAAPGDAAWFDLHLEAQLIASAADGRTPVAHIAEKLGMSPEVVLGVLGHLIAQKLVRLT